MSAFSVAIDKPAVGRRPSAGSNLSDAEIVELARESVRESFAKEDTGTGPPTITVNIPEKEPDSGAKLTPKQQVIQVLGTLVKWIPSEVVVAYGIAVASSQAAAIANGVTPKPDWTIWWVCLAATPVYVLLVSWLTKRMDHIAGKMIIPVLAFALWSSTVPLSVWADWRWFWDNSWAYVLVILIAGLIGLAGEKFAPADSES